MDDYPFPPQGWEQAPDWDPPYGWEQREPVEHGDDSRWYDDAAGPVVRPYALTRGRTRTAGEPFDLIALITADPTHPVHEGAGPWGPVPGLGPESAAALELCRRRTQSVAEIAAEFDLPVGVVRVFLGDLLDAGLIRVSRPVSPAMLPDERILREVINGLRAL
ncbi:DUF742 domain-containing protein [Streptacidiphilus carbonis]|uniref:DUF742 domain-containing protein n=1 Tax=Streptacidiphilus carbonis TaxID=105422 RepID=UPI0009FFD843|nr:DUF742 domain-containing protein [Streptacidiphilus carbonis]